MEEEQIFETKEKENIPVNTANNEEQRITDMISDYNKGMGMLKDEYNLKGRKIDMMPSISEIAVKRLAGRTNKIMLFVNDLPVINAKFEDANDLADVFGKITVKLMRHGIAKFIRAALKDTV